MSITLNAQQLEALHNVKLGNNIFLTGSSGTGKSFCLKQIIEWSHESQINVGVTASTGAASFLIGGRTLHSFLGIGLGTGSASSLASKTLSKNEIVYDRIRFLKLLIIDEISMIGSELFTKISEYLSIIKKNPKPFGGIQMIFSGDFCQLPPVNGEYCFTSCMWKKAKIETIMLVDLIRQQDDIEFQNILQELRWGRCSDNALEILKNLKNTEFPEDIVPTKLYSINVNVDKINQSEFDKLIKLGAVKKIYKNKYSTHPDTKTWSESLKQPKYVDLCTGAQIMVTYNIDGFIINGTRGIIVSMNTNTVNIKLVNNNIVSIPYVKILSSDNDKIYLSFMPLKLAYALSIHKCITENTLIYTQYGLKRIKKISNDNNILQEDATTEKLSLNVIGKTGYNEATQIYKGIIENTFELTTKLGYKLEGTGEHPILIYNKKGEEEWKKIKDIKIGDYLIMKYNTECYGNTITTVPFTSTYKQDKNVKMYNIPITVDYELSYLIGLLIGDGCYSIKNDYPIEFSVYKSIIEIKNIFQQYFKSQFNIDINCYETKNSPNYKLLKNSKHIREFLLWCGLDYVTGKDKCIPWVILENNKQCHINCLQGLFDTDGGVNNMCVHFTSISKQLVIDMQNMLLNLGIISSLRNLNNTKQKCLRAYRLQITGYQAHLYYKYIGFKDIKKQNKLEAQYGIYNIKKIRSNIMDIPNSNILIKQFRNDVYSYYNVTKRCNDIPSYISKWLSTIVNSNKNIKLYDLKFINDNFKDIEKFGESGKKIKYLNDNNLMFNEIVSISESKNQVYDLYVPNDHSFIGNGIINHNSQGSTLDAIEIDIGRTIFEFGQAYVCISRARSLSSIKIINVEAKSFKTHPLVKQFYMPMIYE